MRNTSYINIAATNKADAIQVIQAAARALACAVEAIPWLPECHTATEESFVDLLPNCNFATLVAKSLKGYRFGLVCREAGQQTIAESSPSICLYL